MNIIHWRGFCYRRNYFNCV